jgi:signal peptidase I
VTRRGWRLAKALIGVGLFVLWAVTFRPQILGGPATYLVVRGTSMLPLYETGDLVIARPAPAYGTGDVVGYRVPAGEIGAGRIVLHRIVGGDASAGFVMKGDNNEAADPWHPLPADIVGERWIVVPSIGRAIDWLHQPVVLAALASSVAVALIIGRSPTPSSRKRFEPNLTEPG